MSHYGISPWRMQSMRVPLGRGERSELRRARQANLHTFIAIIHYWDLTISPMLAMVSPFFIEGTPQI